MMPNDHRLRLDVAAAQYLEALECDDFEAMSSFWEQAAADPDLERALHQVHTGLADEWLATAVAVVGETVDRLLPSASIVHSAAGPVTVADVADELFRRPRELLPADAHTLNERLRAARDPLPEDLALGKLATWGEAKFGPAPPEYWKAFRQAALKIELRRAAQAEYYLAARKAPPNPEGRP
jgi:hypothetical protein